MYNCGLGLWSELQCSGNRPPPIGDFTLNKIDKKRALLFAGRLQQTTYNSYYIVNLETAVSVSRMLLVLERCRSIRNFMLTETAL